MKLTFTSTIAVALAIAAIGASDFASAADINVVGARDTPMMRSADTATRGADVKIATKDILNKPTALINKNTLAMDNNVAITRSNIVFSQNDRVGMMKKVEAMVTADDAKDMSTADLSKNILKVVSGKDGTDTATMSKASAVVAAAKDEPSAAVRGQRIADLVNAVFNDQKPTTTTTESESDDTDDTTVEQAIQAQAPSGVTILIGTKDILRQPTGIVNKNIAVSDNQIAISRSTLAPTQNDAVTLADRAKVADYVAPASVINADVKKTMATESEKALGASMDTTDMNKYRVAFVYNKDAVAAMTGDTKMVMSDKNKKDEQFGWGGGLGFGWGYPMGYWNLYGAGLYGGGCGLGLGFGGFFYC